MLTINTLTYLNTISNIKQMNYLSNELTRLQHQKKDVEFLRFKNKLLKNQTLTNTDSRQLPSRGGDKVILNNLKE